MTYGLLSYTISLTGNRLCSSCIYVGDTYCDLSVSLSHHSYEFQLMPPNIYPISNNEKNSPSTICITCIFMV